MNLTHGELFAGVGGFGQGFDAAGMRTVWHVEIDPRCQRVLARHWPDTLILSDVCEVGAHNLMPVDVISFGSPCQDLSVAGKRKGLEGERSGLFYEAIRIINELKPTFAVWENVPGVFSSHDGRDFAAVLGAFRDIGARDICWTVLDAQHFGVPQRRRRLFLVADFGGERAAEILLEPDCLPGHPPKGEEAGTGLALTVGTRIAGGSTDLFDSTMIAICEALQAYGPRGTRRDEYNSLVTHPLTARYDSSEGGCGRGTPLVPTIVRMREGCDGGGRDHYSRPTLTLGTGNDQMLFAPVAFAQNQRGELRTSDVMPQLTCGGGKPGQGYPAVAFTQNQVGDLLTGEVCHALSTNGNATGRNSGKVQTGMAVRRLTPRECERLMGWPDDWTRWTADGKELPDSARYKMCGNGVVASVSRWIGERIVEVTP